MSEAAPVHVVTVVPRQGLGRARALEESLRAAHPDWPVFAIFSDAGRDLGLDGAELLRLTALYDEEELCAALKPWALRRALADGASAAVHLDPEARVEGPLDALVEAAHESGLALTPRAGVEEDPYRALREGVFDARVLAVGPGGGGFLEWWGKRLARHCLRRPDEGLWLDQRWLGAALPFFDAAVVRTVPISFAPGPDGGAPPKAAFDSELRAAYRLALLAAETDGLPEPPNPLTEGIGALQTWLSRPPATATSRPPPVETLVPGVNLVARAGGQEPIDELAASLVETLAALGVPVARIGLHGDGRAAPLAGVDPRLVPYDTTLACLNPADLVRFAFHVDAEFFARRRSVGLWLAEETPAPDLGAALAFLDEVWLPSESAARGLGARTTIPVRAFPLPVVTGSTPAGRAELGLPAGPLVLSVCDLGDVHSPGALERANPLGLAEAFGQAFAEGEGPALVLRLVDGGRNRHARERVRLASERRDVVVLDGPLGAEERRALVRECDCYASLHRATDFELAAAEALADGKPVVTTGTETLRALAGEDGAFLVPATRVPAPSELAAYWTESEWDEPDLGEAAALLRRVFERPEEALVVGARARASLDAGGSRARLSAFLAAELVPEFAGRGRRLGRLLRRTGGR